MAEEVKNIKTGEVLDLIRKGHSGYFVKKPDGTEEFWKFEYTEIHETESEGIEGEGEGGKLSWTFADDPKSKYWEAEGAHEYDYLIEYDKLELKYKLDIIRKSDAGIFETKDIHDEEEGKEEAEEWEEEYAPEAEAVDGMDATKCGDIAKPLFEEAAAPHHEDETGELSGQSYGRAVSTLQRCVGIDITVDTVVDESERWFTYFGFNFAGDTLEQGDKDNTTRILEDICGSYGEQRSIELGIEEDYGKETVKEIFDKITEALNLIEENKIEEALVLTRELEEKQYRLSVARTGTPTPEGR